MNKENGHNEIDQLLLERFAEHTILPKKELWDKVERQLDSRTVSVHKYSRLKLVLIGSAAVIGGLVFLIFVLKNQKPTLSKYSEIKSTEKPVQKEESPIINKSAEIPKNKIILKNASKSHLKPKKELKSDQNNKREKWEESVQKHDKTAPKVKRFSFNKMKALTANNLAFQYSVQPDNLDFNPTSILKSTEKAASKTTRIKKYHYTNHINTRHISAKKYYAKKNENKGLIKAGKFFNQFDLKANLSPMYSTRTVNNLQNVSSIEYDQAFYNRTESGKMTLNGGLELAYKVNPHWSVYSGMKLFRYSQQIQNAQNNYKVISTSQVIIPSSAGNISINGEGIGELSAQNQFETRLKMQFLDIPLIIRHYFSPNFYADAGIKYSHLLTTKTGVSLNDIGINFSVEKIEGLKKHNLGLVLGTGIEHITHSGIRFEVGPEINFDMNNLNPSSEIISKPVSFGIHTGIFLGKYIQM